MDPIIREIYGAPAQDMVLRIVKDAAYVGTNVYLAGINEIRTSSIGHWQLMTHEIIHAFHGHTHFENNQFWRFDSQLMGFEEGFAQAVSFLCMNRYAELYPDDPKLFDPNKGYKSAFYQPTTFADYDFRNHSHLATGNFWSAAGAMGLAIERYDMAASAFLKFYIENNNFFKEYNQRYYDRLNSNNSVTPSRPLLVELTQEVQATVEGQNTTEWINKQHVLTCDYIFGDKIRVHSFLLTHFSEFAYRNTFYHYKTFDTGSDWYFIDSNGNTIQHSYNGRRGIYQIRRVIDNAPVDAGDFHPIPSENPPVVNAYGRGTVHMMTNPNSTQLIPNEIGSHFKKTNVSQALELFKICLLYTSPSPRDKRQSRMPSSA